MRICVQIYEDNEALRKGIEELLMLSDNYEVNGSFGDCKSVEEQVRQHAPDVILMDIDMPEITGIQAVRKIRAFNRNVAIIMLTVFDDNQHVFDAICAGASGYLLKKNVSEKLSSAIQEVMNGGAPLSPAIARMVLNSMQLPKHNYHLTPKELAILQHLSKGLSYKMIATETGLAFETIRSYIKKIYEKLEVHSATEAVSKALNERLV